MLIWRLSLGLLVVTLSACPVPSVTPDAGGPDDVAAFELRAWDRDGEVDIGPNGETPWVWGFQGGTMIRPLLVLPSDSTVSAGDELDVTLRHSPDPEAPGAFRVADGFERFERPALVEERDGELVIGPLDDQLGWTELDGVRLTLQVEVEGLEGTLERRLQLYSDGPPVEHPCYEYAPGLGEGGCVYATVPGTVTLAALSATGTCGTDVSGTFEPEDEDATGCLDAAAFLTEEQLTSVQRVQHPASSTECLEGLGHVSGSTSAATLSFMVEGTCSPGPVLEWSADVSSCACP